MGELISILPLLPRAPRGTEGGAGTSRALRPAGVAPLTIAGITGDAAMPPHMARVLNCSADSEGAIVIPIFDHRLGKAQPRGDGPHIGRTPCASAKTWREGVRDSGSTVAFHFLNLLGSLGDLWRALWDVPSAHDITIGERTPEVRR